MLVIPAIDLMDGEVVRLTRGDVSLKEVYSSSPVEVAKSFEAKGAKVIHVVDLDGALTGKMKNIGSVKEIIERIDIPIQLGGGLRTLEDVERVLNLGVSRVILSTKAITDFSFLKDAILRFGDGRVLVGIDGKGEEVVVKGWREEVGLDIFEVARRVKHVGVKEIVYTDVLCDGTLKGPNFPSITQLAKSANLKLIVSGGFSNLEDIKRLRAIEGVSGVILGKALYTGKISLEEAILIAEGGRDGG